MFILKFLFFNFIPIIYSIGLLCWQNLLPFFCSFFLLYKPNKSFSFRKCRGTPLRGDIIMVTNDNFIY